MPKTNQPAGRPTLFGYSWALFLLAIPAWILIAFLIGSTALAIVWVGVALWGLTLGLVQQLASVYRSMAGHILGEDMTAHYREPEEPGAFNRLRTVLTDGARWRDVAYLFFAVTVGFVIGIAAMIAFVFFPLGYWVSPWLLRIWAAATRSIVGPGDTEKLQQRIGKLEQSRSETIDHSAAELRRIERDLHDGAQARLVALGIELGLAETTAEKDPEKTVELLTQARESTQSALAEIRELVRGIHPPVLADRGLTGGIEALALAHPTPVVVHNSITGNFPAPIESALYFAVAETLTNSAKHSNAQQVIITSDYTDGELTITIKDDGTGGAHFTNAGGLSGIGRRLDVFDGRIEVDSPRGGPTRVILVVPCQQELMEGQ